MIQLLDDRIEILDEIPLFKNMKKGLSLKYRFFACISDLFKMQYLVHLKVSRTA